LPPSDRKSIICSRSFCRKVEALAELEQAVATYTSRAAERLRRGGLATASISVFILTNRFNDDPKYQNTVQLSLPVATDDTGELIDYALRGLKAIYKPGYLYQKAGVMLLNLGPRDVVQTSLFDFRPEGDKERQKRLMDTLDSINCRFGKNAIHYGAMGVQSEHNWQMRASKRSLRYTTRWDELPIVRA
jgi:DNA polymerase V